MNIQFGSGVLYGRPNAGNLATNPTPYKFPVMQDASVEFKGDLKKLWGQKQFPIAKARGKIDVTCKAKIAALNPGFLNQLYFAQTELDGITLVGDDEPGTIPASGADSVLTFTAVAVNTLYGTAEYAFASHTGANPVIGQRIVIAGFVTSGNNVTATILDVTGTTSGTIAVALTTQANETHAGTGTIAHGGTITVVHAADFVHNYGVIDGTTGGQMDEVPSGTPTAGQYKVDEATGIYTFAGADVGKTVKISYSYTDTGRGKTITLVNQLMGYAPEFEAFLYNNFRGVFIGILLASCTMGQVTVPTKQEDFWMSDITFDASVDATDSLGSLFGDV
jgi:hypothetical protein